MTKIYLVVGVPGSGKSWCCEQLVNKFTYVHHDGYIYLKQPGAYMKAILGALPSATKPLLIEAPFSVSEIMEPLKKEGHDVIPLFIIEPEQVVRDRYFKREKKLIPQGHLTRMQTYRKRAIELKAFQGTSTEVFNYLNAITS